MLRQDENSPESSGGSQNPASDSSITARWPPMLPLSRPRRLSPRVPLPLPCAAPRNGQVWLSLLRPPLLLPLPLPPLRPLPLPPLMLPLPPGPRLAWRFLWCLPRSQDSPYTLLLATPQARLTRQAGRTQRGATGVDTTYYAPRTAARYAVFLLPATARQRTTRLSIVSQGKPCLRRDRTTRLRYSGSVDQF
jgi:hypothetical protein